MRWIVVISIVAVSGVADAHIVASPTVNNRYVKLTPAADRVRLAYTIMIGETPGHAARQALDVDGDGQVSDSEVEPWKVGLAERVRAALSVRVDGHAVPVAWAEVVVGLNSPAVSGGAFSLDLIAWLCTGGGARHEVDLVDGFLLTPPGETEVRIEDQPGIRIDVARVGPEGGGGELAGHETKFEGQAAPLANGLRMVYVVDKARPLADGRCPQAAARSPRPLPRWPFLVGGLLALAITVTLTIRRARSTRS